jgi:hypothetical protein
LADHYATPPGQGDNVKISMVLSFFFFFGPPQWLWKGWAIRWPLTRVELEATPIPSPILILLILLVRVSDSKVCGQFIWA